MFLRNVWYVAGLARDLAAGQCVGRKFLNEPIVIYRTKSGALGAIEDRCCHRAMPLSEGHVDGEIIRCCYHGLEFDASGACTRIPGQDRIPASAFVGSYPVAEGDGIVWIWMGDRARADATPLPRLPWQSDPGWAWNGAHYMLKADWRLLADNLMDLSHLAYVHARTIGGNPDMHFATKTLVSREGERVRAVRHMPNSQPPRTYVDAAGFTGPVDRWQEIEFQPCHIAIHTGGCEAGAGAYEGRRDHALKLAFLHGMTPETETTTHYVWTAATNMGLDRGIPQLVFDQIAPTIDEDVGVLEAQQRRMDETPGGKLVDIHGDNGANQVRHLVRQLYESERRTRSAAE